jgi:hypothetical protein
VNKYERWNYATQLLTSVNIPYTVPTAGHIRVESPTNFKIFYPKSIKIESTADSGKKVLVQYTTITEAFDWLKNWYLGEGDE